MRVYLSMLYVGAYVHACLWMYLTLMLYLAPPCVIQSLFRLLMHHTKKHSARLYLFLLCNTKVQSTTVTQKRLFAPVHPTLHTYNVHTHNTHTHTQCAHKFGRTFTKEQKHTFPLHIAKLLTRARSYRHARTHTWRMAICVISSLTPWNASWIIGHSRLATASKRKSNL
jgi:hypothetical protein